MHRSPHQSPSARSCRLPIRWTRVPGKLRMTGSQSGRGVSGGGLEQMILGALQQGQSEDYIDAMVNDAAETGAVNVPSTFLTAEGRVDTASILSALSAPAGPRIPDSYTVGLGDTLAAISYRFYGTLDRQADLRAANPGLADSGLASGQVIALPRP